MGPYLMWKYTEQILQEGSQMYINLNEDLPLEREFLGTC